MSYSFDVIREPWIRVKTFEGSFERVSVRELFENAHKYKEISEPNMFYAYGIHNFLIAFFASVYNMQDVEEKARVLENECFDMTRFNSYIEKCESNRPACFNLFGDNPFYQNKYAKYKVSPTDKCTEKDVPNLKVKDTAMIGKIALDIPSGNNSVHFVSDEIVGKKLSFEEMTKALVSYGLFQAGQDGPNSANGVNGGMNYPLYFMIKGNNVFETIVLNTITAQTWHYSLTDNISYIGNAAWEIEPNIVPKQATKVVSMVEGLTFQNRSVLIADVSKDNRIGNIYFGPDRVFEAEKGTKSLWRQPNAAYRHVKDKKTGADLPEIYPLAMNRPTDIWTEVGNLFRVNESKDIQPLTVQEYLHLIDEYDLEDKGYTKMHMPYQVYYICIDGGKFPPKKQGIYESFIPLVLLKDNEKLNAFCSMIDHTSSVGRYMNSESIRLSKNMDKDLKAKWQKRFAEGYYAYVETELLPAFLNEVSDISQFAMLSEEFALNVKTKAVTEFTNVILSASSRGLYKQDNGSFKGVYGVVNDDIRKLRGTINKIFGIESRKENKEND